MLLSLPQLSSTEITKDIFSETSCSERKYIHTRENILQIFIGKQGTDYGLLQNWQSDQKYVKDTPLPGLTDPPFCMTEKNCRQWMMYLKYLFKTIKCYLPVPDAKVGTSLSPSVRNCDFSRYILTEDYQTLLEALKHRWEVLDWKPVWSAEGKNLKFFLSKTRFFSLVHLEQRFLKYISKIAWWGNTKLQDFLQ